MYLQPYHSQPLKYYNPTSTSSVGVVTQIPSVDSPIFNSNSFNHFRVVSAALILTDLGPNDTRAGRIVYGEAMLNTFTVVNELSLEWLEDQPLI